MAPNPLLTPIEVAERLRVKESQVYTLMRTGQLRALKVGQRGVWRIHEEDLTDYIERLRQDARHRAAEDLATEDFAEKG